MHLLTIFAFAMVFWEAEEPGWGRTLGLESGFWTLLIVLTTPVILGIVARLVAGRALRINENDGGTSNRAYEIQHRGNTVLRLAALLSFGAALLFTPWPDWFRFWKTSPLLQIVGDLIVLSPFFLNILAIWLGMFSFERIVREQSLRSPGDPDDAKDHRWSLTAYLDFNLRHHLLVGAVPMTLILFGADIARGYEDSIKSLTRVAWAPDAFMGVFAAGVFILSPLLLRRIWRTVPLEDGPLRERLEGICRRIGLRVRDILVWHSDGVMINAAVMGLFPRVRFVLLSDALLESMDARQIEAVFGHEAGHVRHRHIQHFLVFAFVGWLAVAGMMELLAVLATARGWDVKASVMGIQTASVAATVLFWGLGFGWLSRRFEREADMFAAKCVTPDESECVEPCSVHLEGQPARHTDSRVCVTGASIFSSALDRVAVLNGIPHEERSWRHSSIGSRIRFLTSLAGDPGRAGAFKQTLRRIRLVVPAVAIIGSVLFVYYWTIVSEPAILRMQGAVT